MKQKFEIAPSLSEISTALLSEEEAEGTTFWALTANLTVCGLGIGMLTLPAAMGSAGIFNAVCWCFFLLWSQYVTTMYLVKAADLAKVYDLEELLETLRFGKFWRYSCIASTWVSFWFILVGYIETFAECVLDLLKVYTQNEPVSYFSLCILGGVIVIPLCQLDQQKLAFASGVSILLTFVIMFAIIYNYFQSTTETIL